MELNIDNQIKENKLTNTDVIQFTKELARNIEMNDTLVYSLPTDIGKFTDENLIKLSKVYDNIITELSRTNNKEIYEVVQIGKSYNIIKEYNGQLDSVTTLQVSYNELPKNCKKGMILYKDNDQYVVDKDITQNLYYKMKEYETDVLNEQQKYLKKMRKNGELYYVKSVGR